jgi:hypothetical protein
MIQRDDVFSCKRKFLVGESLSTRDDTFCTIFNNLEQKIYTLLMKDNILWCAWQESNLQPTDPKSVALSIKLQAQTIIKEVLLF